MTSLLCDFCNLEFSSKHSLRNHNVRKHDYKRKKLESSTGIFGVYPTTVGHGFRVHCRRKYVGWFATIKEAREAQIRAEQQAPLRKKRGKNKRPYPMSQAVVDHLKNHNPQSWLGKKHTEATKEKMSKARSAYIEKNGFGAGNSRRKSWTGYFKPTKPEKYHGNVNNIIYRSRPELVLMSRFDQNPNVLNWSSEETCIPYTDKFDGKLRRYFIDFRVTVRKKDGTIREMIIEYKPKSQTVPPKEGKNKKRFIQEMRTYIMNESKWEAAKRWAIQKNIDFMILTEDDIGLTF